MAQSGAQTPARATGRRRTRMLVLGALTGLALILATRTDGTWRGSLVPLQTVLLLIGASLYASIWALTRRAVRTTLPVPAIEADQPSDPGPDATLPVFYASQTGTAEMYARQTAQRLSEQGLAAHAEDLEGLTGERLAKLRRALFIVSTTDDGNAPYPVSGFVRRVLGSEQALADLHYGLLALGDSYYDTFCGFGRELDTWLRAHGAQALFDRIEVDDNDPAALDAWQERIVHLSGSGRAEAWPIDAWQHWLLERREELNLGSQGEPTFLLELRPEMPPMGRWDAGDIAVIRPRHASTDIERWLESSGLDGNLMLDGEHGPEHLRERLARSELPDPLPLHGRDPDQLDQSLTDLRSRDYSIASLHGDGRIQLLIRQGRRADGTLSLGAAWLTRDAQIGGRIDLRLRRNANFRAPDNAAPLILIGNGTGLAGLRALLRERIANGRLRNWLLFGERQRAHDFYFGEELEAMLARHQLAHLDLAFSRDGPERHYVQDLLLEQADRLRRWVDDGATVCVCGSQEGMASGVDAALRQVLGDASVQSLTEAGRYRRDVY